MIGVGVLEFSIFLVLWLALTGSALWRLRAESGWAKVAWVAVVLSFPLVGPVACHLVQPKRV